MTAPVMPYMVRVEAVSWAATSATAPKTSPQSQRPQARG